MSSFTRVEVLNTGSELLFGSVVNTHLAFLARRLFPLGMRVQRQTTVPDGDAIREAITESASRCDIILVTGGLGPTSDDMTREIVAELTDRPLQFDETIFEKIRERFARRGLTVTDRTSRQAYVPEGAKVMPNDYGTAPGLYLPARDEIPHLLLLPGPPRELCPMVDTYALPILRSLGGIPDLHAKTYRMTGLGESQVEKQIGESLAVIQGLELGYCARMGEVDVRLIGPQSAVESASILIEHSLGPYIVTTEDKEIEEVVVGLLTSAKATLATAESCTGGLLASRITDVPGSSVVFLEGNVTYSNDAKVRTLGVSESLLSAVGAVSEEVARAMAEGALRRAGSQYALSTTGIAGPDGGTENKPVGTVFIGLAVAGSATTVEREFFPTDRSSFKRICTQRALEMLRREILGI
ncbi:MAG TPA: competence/damage-inducible protein A [Chthoniobacterales bacterium]|nr:competence/damage-inducible protein A [Chthoniobacterales bacterium]